MAGYTKLFGEIVDSSIWDESAETCKVWVTLLALCDQDGFVRGSVGWLAGKARVSEEKCAEALEKFGSPDHRSRTPDNDGRRIESLAGGWLILNYLIFRDRLSPDAKASATRERVRRHRERYMALRNAGSVTRPVSASASVSESAYYLGKMDTDIVIAMRAAKKCHPDFANVPDQAIINSLRGFPKPRWMPAIETMGRHYAGARLHKPCGTLENYLAGKNGEHKPDPKTGQRVKYD